MKKIGQAFLMILLLGLSGCQIKRSTLSQHYKPTDNNPFQIDLRSQYLGSYDLRGAANDLLFSNFSTQTIWPDGQWMPAGFAPKAIMELGKDPGLGVRNLHQQSKLPNHSR